MKKKAKIKPKVKNLQAGGNIKSNDSRLTDEEINRFKQQNTSPSYEDINNISKYANSIEEYDKKFPTEYDFNGNILNLKRHTSKYSLTNFNQYDRETEDNNSDKTDNLDLSYLKFKDDGTYEYKNGGKIDMKKKIEIKKSHKGLLHKKLGVPEDKKIPASKLKIKSTDSPSTKKQKQFALNFREDGGNIIETPRGQWDYPGEVTRIPSNNITMQGVNYPVLGISDEGDTQLMKPNKNYKFKGKKVTEYPMKAQDGAYMSNSSTSVWNTNNSNTPQTPDAGYPNNIQIAPVDNPILQQLPQDNTILNRDNIYTGGTQESGYLQTGPKSTQTPPVKPIVPQFKFYGNKYFQRAGNDFNNASKFAAQIPQAQDGTMVNNPNMMINPNANSGLYTQNLQQINPLSFQPLQNNPNAGIQYNDNNESYYQPQVQDSNQESYSPISTSNPINGNQPSGNPVKSGAAIAGTIGADISGGINIAKGALDLIGSRRQNLQEKQREAQMTQQNLVSQAMTPVSSEKNGYGVSGRNSALMEKGGKVKFKGLKRLDNGGINDYKSDPSSSNIEIEGGGNNTEGEAVGLPNGLVDTVTGDKHSQGGESMQLPEQSVVLSDKLKPIGSKKTYAKLAKPLETKDNIDMLKGTYVDPIQSKTANLIIQKKNEDLQKLFQEQEKSKLQGDFGKKIANDTAKEYNQPQFKFGGKLKKLQDGGRKPTETQEQIDSILDEYRDKLGDGEYDKLMKEAENDPSFKIALGDQPNNIMGTVGSRFHANYLQDHGNIQKPVENSSNVSNSDQNPSVKANYPNITYPQTTETGFQYNQPNDITWMNWQRNIDKSAANRWTDPVNRSTGFKVPIPDQETGAKYYGTSDPQTLTNKAYQEQSYDDALDTPEGRKQLAKMWDKTGNTNFGKAQGITIPSGNLSDLNDEDLKTALGTLRPAYIDGQLDYRKVNGIPQGSPQTAQTATAATNSDTPVQNKWNFKKPEQPIDLQGLNIPLFAPNAYSRDPLNYHGVNPNYIDPRYLDVQPQLNNIQRGYSSFKSNLGDRTSAGVSNLLQAQINKYGQEQQVYGQKYNYDRQQDSEAQRFNAEAKTRTDQFNNQSEYQELEAPRRKREGALDSQKRADVQGAIENQMKERSDNDTRDYIQKTFNPWSNVDSNLTLNGSLVKAPKATDYKSEADWNKAQADYWNEKTKTVQAKMGGKVKIKPKFKK